MKPSDIVWEGECDYRDSLVCKKGILINPFGDKTKITCPRCNGTGTITRDATLEEVVEECKRAIERRMWNRDNTINGGILKCQP